MIMSVKEKFVSLAREFALATSPFETVDDKHLYYGEDYKQALIADMEENNLYKRYNDLEFKEYGKGRTKICKITSSARLCYLYFTDLYRFDSNPDDWALEDDSFSFRGDNGRLTRAHFDCHLYKDFFETKCEEFFNKHTDYLPAHFYKNLLKENFDIEGDIPEENDMLFPTLQQFGISDFKGTIYDLHFDMKQLLTHLLALANRKKYEYDIVTLNYIRFIPPEDYWNDDELAEFDLNLYEEFRAIQSALPIKKFCFKHGIILKYTCEKMPIDRLRDVKLHKDKP